MSKKADTNINEGLKSPSRTNTDLVANLGGKPPTKGVEQIDKQNTPPKTPPKGSVRV